MDFYIVMAIIPTAVGLWNLIIATLGLFPQFLSSTIGTLTNAVTRKNVLTKHGRRIPTLTRYSYIYTVNGKKYRYSSEELYSKRRLLPKASMVYVKWFPRHAYPNNFNGVNEWVIGGTMFILGVFLIIIAK